MASTFVRQMQEIANQYMKAGHPLATTREIAAWAIQSGLWKPQPSDLINQCADQLARAMRKEYFTDPHGRAVRAKHAARIENMTLWADIRTAPLQHMEVSLKQRRQQILQDCRQLKADVDSYN